MKSVCLKEASVVSVRAFSGRNCQRSFFLKESSVCTVKGRVVETVKFL